MNKENPQNHQNHPDPKPIGSRHPVLPSYEGQAFDMVLHAWFGRFGGWLSPAAFGLAMFDWLAHLSLFPAKRVDIAKRAQVENFQLFFHILDNLLKKEDPISLHCRTGDKRFKNDSWNIFPFSLYAQTFLLFEKYANELTSNIRGVSIHHEHVINFMARQWLDMLSPSNIPWMNPEVIEATYNQQGVNLAKGFHNFVEDINRNLSNLPPAGTDNFKVGEQVAVTPGKVIYRNRLIELIQYSPTTNKVYAEPILIVPAWIMKYYILDLSPHNSMVKYLVSQGHTVFMISWKNPGSEDRDLGIEDYAQYGVLNALDVINQIVPDVKIHAVGYCVGGTLLSIVAAALGEKSDDRLKTVTLFAGQVDFKSAGELMLFMDESEICYLEDIMWEKGYLDGSQMAGAFSMLHSTDLIWSRVFHDYLMGEREGMIDLIAWDYDTTRLPYKMHSEYLRSLFLNNDLVQGRFRLHGKRVALPDISAPIFAVSTVTDHVAPWRSVYRIHLYTKTDITFVLTTGGHNAGIVSEPGHANRKYQLLTRSKEAKHITPDTWREKAPYFEGSWWPAWHDWLAEFSGEKVDLPSMGNPKKGYDALCDAPGTYVLQK